MTAVDAAPVRAPAARRALPLAAWTVCASTAGLVAVGLVLLALTAAGRLTGSMLLAALVSSLVTAGAFAALSTLQTARFAAAVRGLRASALARLHDPTTPQPARNGGPLGVTTTRELTELAQVLEALHLRVRVGDEVAERHRRNAEAASAGMAELLSGLVAAEEGARGQLAAELHDTVAQSLLSARALLGQADAQRAAVCVDEAEEQVRAVMARTRPAELLRGDLATAVADACADLRQRYGLRVALAWPTEPHPLPLAVAVVVYRFFQESLLNVVKHAEGDTATATLDVDTLGLSAEVCDDGPGFDPARTGGAGGRHVGLALLRERARLAGGRLEVDSSPGGGTRVRLTLPAGVLSGGVAASLRV